MLRQSVLMATFLTALLSAWLAWMAFNFIAMVLGDRLLNTEHAHFNGFRVRIPAGVRAKLTEQELAAVVEHELGHRAHWHPWKNLLRLCFFRLLTDRQRVEQELQADDYVQDPAALARALRKLSNHPFDLQRAWRLEARIDRPATGGHPNARDGRTMKEANIL